MLAANGRKDEAKSEAAQIKIDNLLPEERELLGRQVELEIRK